MVDWYLRSLIKLRRQPNEGNKVSFIHNLQQSPRLLKLYGGGKIEKVWGTFSTFLILGVLSHSFFRFHGESWNFPLTKGEIYRTIECNDKMRDRFSDEKFSIYHRG